MFLINIIANDRFHGNFAWPGICYVWCFVCVWRVFLMICSCIGVAVVIVGPSRSIAIHTLMSLCSALLSVNSASWKVDWREDADLTCLVSHFVEEGADQSDILKALKELQEGGSKEAGWKELSCQWWLLVTNLIMFVWIHLLCLAVPFLVAWWKDCHGEELQRWSASVWSTVQGGGSELVYI